MMYFNIPIQKSKLLDSQEFYKKILGFEREHDGALFSPDYPNVGISFFFDRNSGRAEHCYLAFSVDKNLPSIANKIKQAQVPIDLVTDMLERHYTARFNDPSGNLIQISSETLQDDNGAQFEVSVID